jgi:hypothetical protein
VTVNPGGGSGWDEPPLDIQIPDDARELDRDVLAYRRELRAQRRRNRLLRLAGPFRSFGTRGTVMPLLASILAVCLVAGAMLSVATFSPAAPPAEQTPKATASATAPRSTAPALASATATAATATSTAATATSTAATGTAAATAAASTAVSSQSGSRASHSASPSASASRTHPTVHVSGPG